MKTELHHLLRFIRLFFKRDSPQLCYVVFPFIVSSLFLTITSLSWKDLVDIYLDTTPKFIGTDIAIATVIGLTLYSFENKNQPKS